MAGWGLCRSSSSLYGWWTCPDYAELNIVGESPVRRFDEKPCSPEASPDSPAKAVVSVGLYVFGFRELVRLLEDDAKEPASSHDLGADLMPRLADSGRLWAFPFREPGSAEPEYWRDVGSVGSFYRTSLELTGIAGDRLLRDPDWPVLKASTRRPASTRPGGLPRGTEIEACLLARDAAVGTCRIRRSVVSSMARVGAGADLEDTITDTDSPHYRLR